jgi:polyhydroxyalkanoate synthesis regulator protein
MADAHSTNDGEQKVAIVKKYANRRLYNTGSSSYVTLDDLSQMVRQGKHFVVRDARSGEDLTRSILTQIILSSRLRWPSPSNGLWTPPLRPSSRR